MSAARRTLAIATALASVGIAAVVWFSVRQSDAEPARVLAVTPASGSALATTPDAVTMRLSTSADPVLSHITVRDSTGSTVNDGQIRAAGESGLRQPVRVTLAGDYSVAYHITFTNGHDDSGVLRFSVGTGTAPLDTGEIPEAILDSEGHAHGIDPFGATLLVVDGIVLVVVLALLMRPGRRRPAVPSESIDHG